MRLHSFSPPSLPTHPKKRCPEPHYQTLLSERNPKTQQSSHNFRPVPISRVENCRSSYIHMQARAYITSDVRFKSILAGTPSYAILVYRQFIVSIMVSLGGHNNDNYETESYGCTNAILDGWLTQLPIPHHKAIRHVVENTKELRIPLDPVILGSKTLSNMSPYFVSLILSSLFYPSQAALQKCWWPDGKTVDGGAVPCNQTGDAATGKASSACCDPLDSCSMSGFCLGRSGWAYRGSCTDQTWKSPNCANQFKQCINDDTSGPYKTYAILRSCAQPGYESFDFCCGAGGPSDRDWGKDCCQSSFKLGVTGAAFKPGFDALLQNLTAAANSAVTSAAPIPTSAPEACPTAAAADSAASSKNDDLGMKIGVGVGVPLAVLAVGTLVFLFWRETRRNAHHSEWRNESGTIASAMAYREAYENQQIKNAEKIQKQQFISQQREARVEAPVQNPSYELPNSHR
ncbi:hypothetical protein HYALB_00010808 [Hymenoscyphus albidus]|uniref:Uncharacterized protein n=1 Tax=Hymenoscyphus albidus TaxID=595503 RepID=A0A9N9LMZ3_9HELO|nr:hypothetical protein HYALB_00010808 [Hymenoscyphus albidus]